MKQLLLLACMCLSTWAFAQSGSVSGQVLDGETGEALIGASVIVQGTSKGTITDIEGKFSLGDLENGEITLAINYVGYSEQLLNLTISGGNVDAGTVNLESSAIGLNEVMVLASIAVDRKTPVAVSTLKAAEIESKIGSQEFPEILKSTPGVFATKAGGGFGDGRINLRGFNSENVAVLINGIPVNDMENGRIFWSNWAGLTDATNSMQVQRGLGAVKVAVPSIGGTINILSKASDRDQGGSFYLGAGNDAYEKVGFELSSGLNEKGWAFTISGSKTQGDGFVDGTEFLGYAYFANIAKQINDNHELNFTAIGAKQRHGQRQGRHTLATFEGSPRGIKHNSNWGYLNGQLTHVEDNFYHKPQLSLNHYWTIGAGTELSTALYASFGSGGGGGALGEERSKLEGAPGYNDAEGRIDLDRIYQENVDRGALGSSAIMRASRNDHKWYGLLSSLSHELGSNLTFLGGLDLRYYRGIHFREVTNLLGGQYYLDDADVNDPTHAAQVGDKIDYHNDGIVNWAGFFGQLEYSENDLSAFVSISASNTGYKRVDYFNYTPSDPLREVGSFNFFGYMVKGGANYNLTSNWNVFANVGYFTKAPGFDAIFPNFVNDDPNTNAENQKIFSAELGAGYRSTSLTANLNVYRTQWNDRTFTDTFQGADGEDLTANFLGVNAVHQGLEIDFKYQPFSGLTITGMASIGDWTWQNNLVDVGVFDGNIKVDSVNAYIAGLHVGDAAQTTAALGIRYNLMPDLIIGADYNYYDRLYADFDPIDRNDETKQGVDAWKAPKYGLVDLNLTYNFDISGLNSSLYGNVYNVGNTEYVADAQDGSNSDAFTANVWYGYGITWNLGLKIRF